MSARRDTRYYCHTVTILTSTFFSRENFNLNFGHGKNGSCREAAGTADLGDIYEYVCMYVMEGNRAGWARICLPSNSFL